MMVCVVYCVGKWRRVGVNSIPELELQLNSNSNLGIKITKHLALIDWKKTTARRDEKQLSLGIWYDLYSMFDGSLS